MGNVVAIVGRPNVGKSTLFNRLTETREAITSDIAGTTRDRHYGFCTWNGFSFCVVDTGGYNVETENDNILIEINQQIQLAINDSDIILFLVDCHDGLTDYDKEFANKLRKTNKKIILVANKADNYNFVNVSYDFMQLGFGEPITICANNGSGTGTLLDFVTKNFIKDDCFYEEEIPKIAIIGKPNVGKSSLLNVLVGEKKMIIDDKAGTTRDAIDTLYNLFGQKFILIDTAGIRKKSSKKDNIEFYSTLRSIKAMENCDVCLYIVDATIGICAQDMSLLNLAVKRKKGIVILVNKCDLISKEQKSFSIFKRMIKYKLKTLDFIPIIYISVFEKKNIFQAIKKAIEIYNQKANKKNNVLNEENENIKNSTDNKKMNEKLHLLEQENLSKNVEDNTCGQNIFSENKCEEILKNNRSNKMKITTGNLNKIILPIVKMFPSSSLCGAEMKISYISLLPTKNINIAFFCNHPENAKKQYKRFLEKKIRDNFNLEGIPISIIFKKK